MKNRFFFRELTFLLFGIFLVTSCTDEIDRPVFPISATISHSVKDKQVAFTALTHSAVSWSWTFGDGKQRERQTGSFYSINSQRSELVVDLWRW